MRRQEIFLSFWIWFSSFVIIVQILLWFWLLYWIVSWVLFLWLWFMIRYERVHLRKQGEILWNILEHYRDWIISWEWNLNSKKFWNWNKIQLLLILLPIILSLAYLYMWIQNAFVPYSTAWDANHEYMYIPKILAENAWIYWWNTVANTMPWFWHQFLTFVFSLTGCTGWWFGLSSDNIAISMNNMSAFFVLIFWIGIIFQIFSLLDEDKIVKDEEKIELKKWKNLVIDEKIKNVNWITMWWYILLLWLTCWMWAFLVIVDNKTDLWVMSLSLLALLAWLIFLQIRRDSKEKLELFKYIIIAGLFFWFAALWKITAFVDFVLFGLLLVWLWFSSLSTLGLWIMVMWLVRKFNVLTSSVMLTDNNATWFIIIWWIITIIWIIIYFLKDSKRKNFWKNVRDLAILWICFLIPLILLKLPWATISQIKTNNFSIWNSLRAVFLSMNNQIEDNETFKFLTQNTTDNDNPEVDKTSDTDSISLISQDKIDDNFLDTYKQKNFSQCLSAWNIYTEEELISWLQTITWWQWWEDFWRYIWYGWKEFTKTKLLKFDDSSVDTVWYKISRALWPKSNECEWLDNSDNVICVSNTVYWLLKFIRKNSDNCYGLNHDAKVLCNNSEVIDDFKIDDLRAIYDNWIKDKQWEAGILLKTAIDNYDKAKSEWRISIWAKNSDIFYDEIVNLRQYYQSHSISSDEDSVNIPYRYLVPLNISFNWSLQNLSSYYTDIGYFWIIVYLLLIIALPYAIIKRNKILTSITLTTLIWWGIRWIIWSSILWYWTVLISWTMLTLVLFWNSILLKDNNENLKIIPWFLIILVWVIFWIQIIFNFLRIASQWANSVFVRYKWSVWQEQIINNNLESVNKEKFWYWWKNIFDLQFPQYNPIINALANRDDKDWVIVAWTYIQYFLWNQWNIKSDWMLSDFWKNTSDWDLCKTYWRLKNDNTRYLIIDPNIWTVTMWEWNETLFYRFFWKLNQRKTKIEIDWTITTLVRLARAWYINLLSTNNIWSKYAFIVDDNTIRQYFGLNLTDEELILTRAKMAVLQYFDDAESIFQSIINIFITRIMYDVQWWIEDIANIYWLEVDSNKLKNIAYKYINWQSIMWDIEKLSNDEKAVLINYINIYSSYKWWDSDRALYIVQSLLVNSVSGWSQIIALELN